MSVTIDSLDIQIRSSAGSAADNIGKLADSLGRLRDNAKLTTVSNNLTKLATALGELKVNSTSLNSIRGLAGAMKSLSSIQKSSGLNSTINSLKKLPAVVNELDPAQITAFAAAMRKLADGLAPLAAQVEKMGNGFSKLPPKVQQCVTAVKKLDSAQKSATDSAKKHHASLNTGSINLMAVIDNYNTLISTLNTLGDMFTRVMGDAVEWDGIQFRFGRAFGEDADMVLEYARKVSEELKINMQQFMQYSSLYGSLLSGFGMAQKQVTTISVGLTELSYDIWAAYNDRYKTLEDASEAVRSAITGEIEPIRNAGIALTEASMQEYLDSIGKAHLSIEKLTEAQKAEVRYAVMVNSAMNQGIIGTYAREMQTAEGAVRTLSQQLKTLGQAIGSLFIPILSIVVPYLSAFVELLYEGVAAIAAFFGISLFEIDWSTSTKDATDGLDKMAEGAKDATGALGDTADAANKLKNYTMGFDELNVIDPNKGSKKSGAGSGAGGAGGGSLGLDLDTLWDDSVFASASKQVDELKAKIKSWFDEWKVQIGVIAGALATLGMAGMLRHLGEAWELGDKFLNSLKNIKKVAATAIVVTVQYSVMAELFDGYIDGEGFKNYLLAMFVGAIGTAVLYSMWGSTGIIIGLSVIAAASISAIVENGGIDSTESAIVALTGFASAVGAVGLAVKKVDFAAVGAAISKFTDPFKALIGSLRGSTAATSALTFMSPTLAKITTSLTGAGKAVGSFVAGISAPVWGTIVAVVAAIASGAYFLYKNWDKVTAAVKTFFKANIAPKLKEIKEHWGNIKKALVDARDSFLDAIPPEFKETLSKIGKWIDETVDKFKEWFKSVEWMKGIGKAIEVLGGIVVGILGGAIAGFVNQAVSLFENLSQIFSGVIQTIGGFVEFWIALFTGDDLTEPINKIIDGIADIFGGLWGLITDPIKEFYDGVIGWFTALWDELVGHSIVPDTINEIVDWFLSLPGKILDPIKEFCDNILKKFKDLWASTKSWWNTNVAPKFTKTYWSNKFDVIRQGAAEKLEAAKKVIQTKWGEVKTWFSDNVAPKFTLKYWTDKFENVRKGAAEKLEETKTTIIGKWDAIKKWFTENVSPKLTKDFWLDKFEYIKTALVETIKNALNAAIEKVNTFITWINKNLEIEIPEIEVAGKVIFEGAVFRPVTIPKIPYFAEGGFPNEGQMFIAREAGPELVGRFGNRTAVANNDQIVAGITEGVYQAVIQAMTETNGGRSDRAVNVYLDGKQIYASVKKTEAERGLSLMGNQLGYSY